MIIVGNTAPVVELTTSPAPGEPFQFGDTVTYQVTVTDDAPVDCSTVTVAYILGHDEHGHPLSSTAGLHRHDHHLRGLRPRRRRAT